jgi:hypothetical protein
MKTFTVLQAARRFDSKGFNAIGDDLDHTANVVKAVLDLAGISYALTPPDDSGEERFTPEAPEVPEPSAFPKFAAWQRGGQIECGTYGDGITQRAYIAARCLQGMLANAAFGMARNHGERSEDARRAVECADALLSHLAETAGKDGAL